MPALVDDPALLARILRELRVKGQLAPFTISELAMPVFDIGKVTGLAVQEVITPGRDATSDVLVSSGGVGSALNAGSPGFNDSDIVSDSSVAPVGGTVLADSGALAAGARWCHCSAGHDDGAGRLFDLEWRNAANTANLAVFHFAIGQSPESVHFSFRLKFSVNQRLRWVTTQNITNTAVSWIATVSAFES